MLIAIDHGNKQIKSSHTTFSSGLYVSDTKPPFGDNVLFYDGKYYTLSDQRIPYMRDKTIDERFFVLTLFAIASELKYMGYSLSEQTEVSLAVGLPPAHFGAQYKRFEKYFLDRGIISYSLNGTEYKINITKAKCFPQAYAAAMPIYQQIKDNAKVVIVDIGGFTADYLLLKKGLADLQSCDSLENGVISLYNRVASKINADFDLLLEESDIDAILQGKENEYDENVSEIVIKQAQQFVEDLFGKLRERMIDLRTSKAVFVGGGSLLLKKQIEASNKVSKPIFVNEIAANCKGYELLYRASNIGR